MSGRAILAVALSAVLASPPVPADASSQEYKEQFKDEIVLAGGRGTQRVTGVEVTAETYDKVEWKSKTGVGQSKPPSEVVSIAYADIPEYFVRGLEAWKQGRWAEAEQEFRGAVAAVTVGKARKMFEGRSKAYIGDCQRRLALKSSNPAELDGAAQVLAEALKLEPKSPVLDVVLLGLAECQSGLGRHDEALKTLDDLRTLAGAGGLPLWEARARRMRGVFLERKGETAAAANEFQDLAQFADSRAAALPAGSKEREELERMKVAALVRKGWALYARAEKTKSDADVNAAKGYFDSLPSLTGDSAMGKAAALNGNGGILLLRGKAKEALENFLRVEVTLFAVPEEVARALWYKAMAYEQLGEAAGREQALKDLKDFYPWSEWASRAR